MIEQELKLREKKAGLKPMRVAIEGVGSVEVFMVKLISIQIRLRNAVLTQLSGSLN